MSAVVAAALLGLGILLWTPKPRADELARLLAPSLPGEAASPRTVRWAERLRSVWHQDPAELLRDWRSRRHRGALADGVLAILEGISPALAAGLTPSAAARLASNTIGGNPRAEMVELVHGLLRASDRGTPIAPVWRDVARRTGSAELGFVAAAWRLSEVTGAPLAEAVDRAVASLRQARERRRRVDIAVAGPRATVSVLTVLPLTGPVFGLACGVSPGDLYFGSPIGGATAVAGLILIWVGRWWCQRMVASATASGSSPRSGAERSAGASHG